ncbi:MarR family winged helix-turn-helix transcriptional regulator [Algirhabdus cladophorae]|uniref:MarR family winged helix-turn-helix transcriptional regulator n=1 Tax=Algirhabdus cladophorae TaxID=3377108 RepID=UPI003B845B7A
MTSVDPFDLRDFLPYLLAQAAEETSLGFQKHYKDGYGMLRNEWRVLFHLGRYGAMSARDICERAKLHKTKVSRAVAALERRRFLARSPTALDRRVEVLDLTKSGHSAYLDLAQKARSYDAAMVQSLSAEQEAVLRACLAKMAKLP